MDTNSNTNKDNTDSDSGIDLELAPLVFQCQSCRVIVGDSMSFFSSNEDNHSISLEKACNVTHSNLIITSREGDDIGCSYVKLYCDCGIELGKFYCTTSKDYDSLRDKFTLDIHHITSYELGKNQLGKIPDKKNMNKLNNNENNNSDGNSNGNDGSNAKYDEEITKVCICMYGVFVWYVYVHVWYVYVYIYAIILVGYVVCEYIYVLICSLFIYLYYHNNTITTLTHTNTL